MALSNVAWKGMKALEVMADVLPSKLGGQKLRAAYKYALKPTLSMMRANLPPNRTGALWHATDITIGGTQEMQQMYQLPFEAFEKYCPYGSPEEVAAYLIPFVRQGASVLNIKPCAENDEIEIENVAEVCRIIKEEVS